MYIPKIPLNPTRNGAKLRRIIGFASKKAKKIQINMNLRLPNILHNPSADLFCAVLCAAFHLDFGRADAGLRVISHHKERTFYWLLGKDITLQLAEKGDEERDAEVDQDAMEDGHEHEVVAGIARDDGKCGVHRGSSSRADRCQSSEVTDE